MGETILRDADDPKLAAGFPHIAIAVPASAVEDNTYSLCRFNVAMTRQLRRDGKPGFPESDTNGRYYGSQQIPVARTLSDKQAMLAKHFPGDMIEVLIHGDLTLPDETTVQCYSGDDINIAKHVLAANKCPWTVSLAPEAGNYPRSPAYAKSITEFIDMALANPAWRGNGLEFDKV